MNNEEFELLRDNFLRDENGLISYLKNNSGDVDKIKEVLKALRQMPTSDLKSMAEKKFEDIEYGRVKEEDLERAECELTLLLMCIPPDLDAKKEYWQNKMKEINANDRKENGKVLIEIGAQHPLIAGKPGEEFAARLDRGIELYNKEVDNGNEVTIYIPGSTHSIYDKAKEEWQTDKSSLSKAGFEYLVKHGIPAEKIKSEETNDIYMKRGVYNSGDECLVSCSLAKDLDCSRVISVNSPVQLYRKALFYIENGYKPEIYSVPLSNTYHNYVGELFWSLYVTSMEDHTWQEGFLAEKTRQERNVNFDDEVSKETEDIRQKIYQILREGLNLPESVYEKKAEWMAKYQKAKDNMKERASNENVLIRADFTEENFDAELDMLCEAIKKAGNKNCLIHKNIIADSRMSEIAERLKPLLAKGAKVGVLNDFDRPANEVFYDRRCSDLFIVCSSDKTIRKAIEGINDGIIPQVFAVPSKDDDFIKEIFEMYKDIMREEKGKETSHNGRSTKVFEGINWDKVMENDEER